VDQGPVQEGIRRRRTLYSYRGIWHH
jgi:hypothetical protein